MKSLPLILISFFFLYSSAQNKPSYLIYDQNGVDEIHGYLLFFKEDCVSK